MPFDEAMYRKLKTSLARNDGFDRGVVEGLRATIEDTLRGLRVEGIKQLVASIEAGDFDRAEELAALLDVERGTHLRELRSYVLKYGTERALALLSMRPAVLDGVACSAFGLSTRGAAG